MNYMIGKWILKQFCNVIGCLHGMLATTQAGKIVRKQFCNEKKVAHILRKQKGYVMYFGTIVYGAEFYTPPPPHPENALLGVVGVYKRGGAAHKIPAAWGLRIYTPTPLPWKMPFGQKWGGMGGYIISPWIVVQHAATQLSKENSLKISICCHLEQLLSPKSLWESRPSFKAALSKQHSARSLHVAARKKTMHDPPPARHLALPKGRSHSGPKMTHFIFRSRPGKPNP